VGSFELSCEPVIIISHGFPSTVNTCDFIFIWSHDLIVVKICPSALAPPLPPFSCLYSLTQIFHNYCLDACVRQVYELSYLNFHVTSAWGWCLVLKSHYWSHGIWGINMPLQTWYSPHQTDTGMALSILSWQSERALLFFISKRYKQYRNTVCFILVSLFLL
jgi:hypothetical protein